MGHTFHGPIRNKVWLELSAICEKCGEKLVIKKGLVLLGTYKWGHSKKQLRFHKVKPVEITQTVKNSTSG